MADVPPDSRIVYVSNNETGHTVLRGLLEAGVPIAEVVSLDPDRADTYGVSGYQSFADLAAAYDVPVYYPESFSLQSAADRDHFQTLAGDVLVVNGWQRLVPDAIVETFTHGAIGNHGSAFGLPYGRGRSPLNWSLIEDLDRFLISLITLEPEADAGQLLATRKFDITDYDDIRTLYYKIAMTVEEMLFETLGPLLRGDLDPDPQTGDPTFYPKRTPDDGAIHWEATTRDVYNLVRAVTRPYPGAFTEHAGTRIFVWEAIPFSDDLALDAPPGQVVQTFETTGDFVVSTPDGTLLVTDWEAADETWCPERGLQFDSLGAHDRVDRAEHRHNLSSSGSTTGPESDSR